MTALNCPSINVLLFFLFRDLNFILCIEFWYLWFYFSSRHIKVSSIFKKMKKNNETRKDYQFCLFIVSLFVCFKLLNFIYCIQGKIKSTNVLINSRNHIICWAQDWLRPRRLKRILVRGDLYLCRKSFTRFSSSSSAQADPISRRVLGNALSDR